MTKAQRPEAKPPTAPGARERTLRRQESAVPDALPRLRHLAPMAPAARPRGRVLPRRLAQRGPRPGTLFGLCGGMEMALVPAIENGPLARWMDRSWVPYGQTKTRAQMRALASGDPDAVRATPALTTCSTNRLAGPSSTRTSSRPRSRTRCIGRPRRKRAGARETSATSAAPGPMRWPAWLGVPSLDHRRPGYRRCRASREARAVAVASLCPNERN
jgi:hypothetical protein